MHIGCVVDTSVRPKSLMSSPLLHNLLPMGFIPVPMPAPPNFPVLGWQPPSTAGTTWVGRPSALPIHQRHRPSRGATAEAARTASTTAASEHNAPSILPPKTPYKVYRTYHRLIGAPRFTPPLHTRVHAVPMASNTLELCAASYDIIPQRPTELATILALISGQCVPAVVRIRNVSWPLRDGAAFTVDCGDGAVDESLVSAWVHSYSGCTCHHNSVEHSGTVGLSLFKNNCWTFANQVKRIMLGLMACSR